MTEDQLIKNLLAAQMVSAKGLIIDLLSSQEPCTFEQVVDTLIVEMPGCTKANAVPIAVNALAEMQQSGEICEWEQIWQAEDGALEYCWQLSEETGHRPPQDLRSLGRILADAYDIGEGDD